MGRRLKVDPIKGREVYVTASTVRGLKLKEGDDIEINIDFVNDFLYNSNFLNVKNDGNLENNKLFEDTLVKFLEDNFNIPAFNVTTQ